MKGSGLPIPHERFGVADGIPPATPKVWNGDQLSRSSRAGIRLRIGLGLASVMVIVPWGMIRNVTSPSAPSVLLGEEPQLPGPGDRLAAGGDLELPVQRIRLRLDGVRGQEQLGADLGE